MIDINHYVLAVVRILFKLRYTSLINKYNFCMQKSAFPTNEARSSNILTPTTFISK